MCKSLFVGVRRKCDVIYRENVRFDSEQTGIRNKRRGETVSCGGTARGLVSRSKNHSRNLPLTFLRFAQPRGDDAYVRTGREEESSPGVSARCSRRWRSTDRFCLPTRSFAPLLAVPRTEGSFFGVTDSRHILGSRVESPATSRGGCLEILHVPQCEISARSKVLTDSDILQWDVCIKIISD